MATLLNETKDNLLKEVNIGGEQLYPILENIVGQEHKYIKDLKINVSNALNGQYINRKESLLLALAVAINEKNAVLRAGFSTLAIEEGASGPEVAEIAACVSLLNVNNVFYRFRHFVKKDFYHEAPAGIKMSIMMNPVLGKEFFELVSLVISSLNGCEMCVNAHEESLIRLGASESRILEAIKLGAVIKGLSPLVVE
ncbi:carboxymuconolactone decarboxylase family protein [Cytophagaceae bacterium ABcell3]|nr:carboxymuconolactone decarboxylase family protein [Cytophagaceae bacterium ABcell3]